MDSPTQNCLVVCGPTACGKTALGVRLALELGGEILSADSRQVYRGMDIGTGKDLEEYSTPRGKVDCHLVDIADPSEVYSLFQYQRDFYRAFGEVAGRGRLPVVVGGTGLYIEAALKKWEVPDVPADEPFRREMMRRDLGDLVADLRRRDPELAGRTVFDCKRRVVRALEVARHVEAHGKPRVNETSIDFRPLVLVVDWPGDGLRERIRARLLRRLEAGLVDEVRGLLGRGIPRERWDLFGMEYRQVASHLAGEIPYDAMVRELLDDIWYMARRQRTYFRGIRKRGLEAHDVPRADPRLAMEIVRR